METTVSKDEIRLIIEEGDSPLEIVALLMAAAASCVEETPLSAAKAFVAAEQFFRLHYLDLPERDALLIDAGIQSAKYNLLLIGRKLDADLSSILQPHSPHREAN